VLTALGRRRASGNSDIENFEQARNEIARLTRIPARPLSAEEQVELQKAQVAAQEIRSRGIPVRAIGTWGVQVEPRRLTPEEYNAIMALPDEEVTYSFGNRNVQYNPDEPTQSLVGTYMMYEGYSFDEAVAKIRSEQAEFNRRRAESQALKPTLDALDARIRRHVNIREMNTNPVVSAIQTTASQLATALQGNPATNVRQQLSDTFPQLTSRQLDLLTDATTKLAQYRTDRMALPYTSAEGYDDNPVYLAHKRNASAPDVTPATYNVPYYEFIIDYLNVGA